MTRTSRTSSLSTGIPGVLSAKTKICTKCGKRRRAKKFSVVQGRWLKSWCKDCDRKNAKNWRRENPERAAEVGRAKKLRERYGMTTEEYDRRYAAQEGKCLVCGAFMDRLHVDHDHQTKEVRGLLCDGCNGALGKVNDRPDVLRKLAEYLEQRLWVAA